MTKTQLAKNLLNEGKIKESLKIYKTFRLGITKEEQKQIARASEMTNGYESFFVQLGYKKDIEIEKAINIIRSKFWI